MIIEFSLGNYRSFNEVQTLSFRATGLTSEDKAIDERNIAEVGGQRLLKTIGVYGANASGKSNLIKGLSFVRDMVEYSLSFETFLSDWMRPNLQNTSLKDDFGYFQIVMLIGNSRYRYGFTLGENVIDSEWLFGPAEKNETWYFKRKANYIEINKDKFVEGIGIPYESKLRPDTLFVTFCSSYNGSVSGNIKDLLSNHITTGIDTRQRDFTRLTNLLVKEGNKEIVLQWLMRAGLTYNDIYIENIVPDQNVFRSRNISSRAKLMKNTYNNNGEIAGSIEMDLLRNESEGTQKYYALIGQLHEKFENGGLLFSDEIDSNFHPALLIKIIGMFNNPAINKANAQLLFTSHDTNLMNPEIMRRDQFYFTEKSATDATVLYSLADLKGIRNNADFAKQYLAGYYGALPMLNTFTEPENNH